MQQCKMKWGSRKLNRHFVSGLGHFFSHLNIHYHLERQMLFLFLFDRRENWIWRAWEIYSANKCQSKFQASQAGSSCRAGSQLMRGIETWARSSDFLWQELSFQGWTNPVLPITCTVVVWAGLCMFLGRKLIGLGSSTGVQDERRNPGLSELTSVISCSIIISEQFIQMLVG